MISEQHYSIYTTALLIVEVLPAYLHIMSDNDRGGVNEAYGISVA